MYVADTESGKSSTRPRVEYLSKGLGSSVSWREQALHDPHRLSSQPVEASAVGTHQQPMWSRDIARQIQPSSLGGNAGIESHLHLAVVVIFKALARFKEAGLGKRCSAILDSVGL